MKKISTLVLTFVVLATQHLFAVPANPAPATFIQSDGSEITVHLRGDEFFSWHETVDGHTLIRQENGDFVLATLDQNVELQRIKSELPERRAARRSPIVRPNQQGPHIGRQMVILVEFANVPFRTSYEGTPLYGNELFDSIMNAENHTMNGAMGSVRQYFLDVSNGMFDAQSTVFGPILLPENRAFYGGNDAEGWDLRPHIMVQHALQALANQGTDFSPFVNPATNLVDGVHIIFAGCGEENIGCPAEAIWSHKWTITGTADPMTIGGVQFLYYSVSPELAGTSNMPTHIGVIVHELGHSLLGWPDSYSVGNTCVDFGNWCVMASGVWNHDGRRPAKPSAWFVADAGWVEERVLDAPQNVTMPNPAQNRVIYRINTQTVGEYFLLDNRQQIGWDVGIPSSGLLISHVDRTPGATLDWARNEILTFCNRRRLYIKQPGCANIAGCASAGNIGSPPRPNPNRPTDVWPQPGFTEFTDNSVPNARSWADEPTNKPVTQITHNAAARTISFAFMDDGDLPPIVEPATVPYFEGFEGSGAVPHGPLPEGWTQYPQTQDYNAWFPTAGVSAESIEATGPDFFPRTGQRQMVRIWEDAGDFAWAFSEPIQLYAGTIYTVSFWYLAPGYVYEDETYYDNFKVQIAPSRELIGTGANAEMTGATTLLIHEDRSTTTWTQVTVEFTPAASGPHYLGFHCMTEFGFGLIITIDDISITKPVFEITLSQTEMHTFDTLVFGYDENDLTPLLVTITNTGNQPTGELHISLLNRIPPAPPTDFELSNLFISNIAVGEYSTFTVVPIVGRDIGTHTETITVFGTNDILENFDVRFTVIEDTTTNIANVVNAAPLQVFPNPVTDYLRIVIPSNARDLEIFDMNGRRVFVQRVETLHATSLHDDGTIVIDISHLPNGTYIVRIGNRSTVIVKQ